mmetsp:Transcript_130455/g.363473  ORF Transcript_130455/g.363473 Transcript_130455/m.363473 type:complete len:204 (-) Transcript_130455:772-1383(-)
MQSGRGSPHCGSVSQASHGTLAPRPPWHRLHSPITREPLPEHPGHAATPPRNRPDPPQVRHATSKCPVPEHLAHVAMPLPRQLLHFAAAGGRTEHCGQRYRFSAARRGVSVPTPWSPRRSHSCVNTEIPEGGTLPASIAAARPLHASANDTQATRERFADQQGLVDPAWESSCKTSSPNHITISSVCSSTFSAEYAPLSTPLT